MRFLICTLFVIIGYYQISADINSDWKAFKIKYNRVYNAKEDAYRKTLFEETLKKVAAHEENFKKGVVTYNIGVNIFADMTNDEFNRDFNGRVFQGEYGRASMSPNITMRGRVLLPQSVNWVKYGFNTTILNQGKCASCYVFSAIGAIEGQIYIKYKKLIQLSHQELLDCSKQYGNNGCKGGWQRNNFRYILSNGIGYASYNPYKDNEQSCIKNGPRIVIKNYYEVPYGNELELKRIVAQIGTVPVDMDASLESFRKYTGGVYYDKDCSTNKLGHSMTVVGYGNENGQDFWLLKNSWGSWWGDKGYIKVARNRNNHCGIASRSVFPVVK